jgi:hypothetical protein
MIFLLACTAARKLAILKGLMGDGIIHRPNTTVHVGGAIF